MRARWLIVLVVVAAIAALTLPLAAQAPPPTSGRPPGAFQAPASQQQPGPRLPGMGAPSPATEPPSGENVPATAPVITIDGYCQSAAAKPCQTVITKSDFETLLHALDPNMAPQARQGLADQYVKIVIMDGNARKQDLQDRPRTKEVMRFVQTQVMANLFNQYLQDEAKKIPDAEIQSYYDAHKQDYEEATIRRLYIPKNVPPDAKKLSDAELAALAADIDKRAKAGEDFSALQKDVYDKLGIKGTPPPTDMGAQRRTSFPPDQQAIVFGLAAGQVTDVEHEQVGDFIFKIVSKRTLPLDEAKTDIQSTLARQRYTDLLAKIFAPVNVKLNPEYFGPYAQVTLPGQSPKAPPAPAPPAGAAPGAATPKPPAPPQTSTKPPGI